MTRSPWARPAARPPSTAPRDPPAHSACARASPLGLRSVWRLAAAKASPSSSTAPSASERTTSPRPSPTSPSASGAALWSRRRLARHLHYRRRTAMSVAGGKKHGHRSCTHPAFSCRAEITFKGASACRLRVGCSTTPDPLSATQRDLHRETQHLAGGRDAVKRVSVANPRSSCTLEGRPPRVFGTKRATC